MYTLQAYAKHVALWLLPAFIVWWLSVQPILLPLLATVQDSVLQASYQRARASLNSDTLTDWHIETKLLLAEKSAAGQWQTWNVQVGNPTAFTLGLPLAWVLLLASPNARLGKTVLATAIVLPFTVLTITLKLNALMLDLLAAEQPFLVYVTSTIQVSHQPVSAWLPEIVSLLADFVAYATVVALPAWLAYWLNRDWWQVQYQLRRVGFSE